MYKDEFPDYDAELWVPNGFVDASWHNDACPHVEKNLFASPAFDLRVEIWQDYKDIDKREYDHGCRYMFVIRANGSEIFTYGTDNLYEIKEIVIENGCNWGNFAL